MDVEPIIITSVLDTDSQSHFDELRRSHFPPERNLLAAHVTLFHALPADNEQQIINDIRDVMPRSWVTATVTGVRLLGNGVAFDVQSLELMTMRAQLVSRWQQHLTPQDLNKHDLHVTVQNKVKPEEARALHRTLDENFAPYEVMFTGVRLWRYMNGPWDAMTSIDFDG